MGHGASILCKIDIWIPHILPNCRRAKEGHDSQITQVFELLDPNTNNWDPMVVRNKFIDEDANFILSILWVFVDNEIASYGTLKDRQYLIKSSYHVARQLREEELSDNIGGLGPES